MSPPIIAYITLENLQDKLVLPDNANVETHPYIMAVLIALAQLKRRHEQLLRGNVEMSYNYTPVKVHLLILSASASDHEGYFLLYAASVPSSLLYQLDHPSKPIQSEPTTVDYYRLPLKPSRDEVADIYAAIALAFTL